MHQVHLILLSFLFGIFYSSSVLNKNQIEATFKDYDLSDFHAQWWRQVGALEKQVNPLFDTTGANCGQNQGGPVWFLHGASGSPTPPATILSVKRSCRIASGLYLLIPLINFLCDTVPSFSGTKITDTPLSHAKTATCQEKFDSFNVSRFSLLLDNVVILTEASKSIVNAPTCPFDIFYPANNHYQNRDLVQAGIYKGVAVGFIAMLSPLEDGFHKIVINNFFSSIEYDLTVGNGSYKHY